MFGNISNLDIKNAKNNFTYQWDLEITLCAKEWHLQRRVS